MVLNNTEQIGFVAGTIARRISYRRSAASDNDLASDWPTAGALLCGPEESRLGVSSSPGTPLSIAAFQPYGTLVPPTVSSAGCMLPHTTVTSPTLATPGPAHRLSVTGKTPFPRNPNPPANSVPPFTTDLPQPLATIGNR